MRLITIITAATLVLTAACKKKDDAQPGVLITVTSPAEGSMVAHGDSVRIRGTVTAPVNIHGFEFWVLNLDRGDTLYKGESHAHGTNIALKVPT